jgi:hypothetical protein
MLTTLAFLTCHEKDAAVKTALAECGFEIQICNSFNTDSLGTFTGEQARPLTQMQTALKKAQMACELTGRQFGLGSEGSFGPHPQVHLLPWNYEVLAFWDAQQAHAIYAVHGSAETNYASQRVSSTEEALSFANQVQFPSHALILGSPFDAYFAKGIASEIDLQNQLNIAFKQDDSIWLETDMRAHMNPSRMKIIEQTAYKLQALLRSQCPTCKLPGFGVTRYIKGALCNSCGTPTRLPNGEHWECAHCQHAEVRPLKSIVSAANCDVCNP